MSHEKFFKAVKDWQERNPLRQYCRKHKISLRQMAAIAGVSHTTIYAWERGLTMPSRDYWRIDDLVNYDEMIAWYAQRPRPKKED